MEIVIEKGMSFIFKIDKVPPIVQKVLEDLDWVEFDETEHDEDEWNLCWKTTR